MELRKAPNGLFLDISVRPNSGELGISYKDGKVIIFLKSPPEGGRANLELVKFLSKALGSEVRVVSGFKSKKKTLLIMSDDAASIKKSLLPNTLNIR